MALAEAEEPHPDTSVDRWLVERGFAERRDGELVATDAGRELAGQSSTSERSQVLDRALATAPKSRARPLRLRLPDSRSRCTVHAATVHHLVPSSQAPELFWEPANLVAACRLCNYGDGARVAAENTRRTIEDLRLLVERQQTEIDRLLAKLASYENGEAERPRATPRIY